MVQLLSFNSTLQSMAVHASTLSRASLATDAGTISKAATRKPCMSVATKVAFAALAIVAYAAVNTVLCTGSLGDTPSGTVRNCLMEGMSSEPTCTPVALTLESPTPSPVLDTAKGLMLLSSAAPTSRPSSGAPTEPNISPKWGGLISLGTVDRRIRSPASGPTSVQKTSSPTIGRTSGLIVRGTGGQRSRSPTSVQRTSSTMSGPDSVLISRGQMAREVDRQPLDLPGVQPVQSAASPSSTPSSFSSGVPSSSPSIAPSASPSAGPRVRPSDGSSASPGNLYRLQYVLL
jgi:hypothetical protein